MNLFEHWFFWLVLLAVVLAAVAAFWLLWRSDEGKAQHHAHAARKLRVPPEQWPLSARPVLNTLERSVWLQLAHIFPESMIMVKMPITRFTVPRRGEEARDWFEMLNSLYCTFTICSDEGRVLGCVDVAGPSGVSAAHSNLKHQLLSQCGIAYFLLSPGAALPPAEALRSRFLGIHDSTASDLARLQQARQQLHKALNRKRNIRNDSGPASWQQNDSFLAPFDSRHNSLSR